MNVMRDEFFGTRNKLQEAIILIWALFSVFDAFVFMEYRDYLVTNNVQLSNIWYFVVWHTGDFNNVPFLALFFELPLFFFIRRRYITLVLSALATTLTFYYIEVIQSKDPMDYPIVLVAIFLYVVYRVSKKESY